ncbi:MAG TPA: putative baseplate assembly protein [Arachnia sp.]|nr:putative baseplate assembly protein [Arachnia sp.]HMT85301.1 putative baseplate assembly protein [Arachnia sp.]
MTIPSPNLDNRDFADLMREARQRIPRFTPEWTNFNDSDPGMALVQLHAWLAETLLYELNRVPELNYTKFLNLIGTRPRPARPARTNLEFTLDKLADTTDPLTVAVPIGTRVGVDDPDIQDDISFETDRALIAINAAIGAVIAWRADGSRALVTGYGKEGTQWLFPFQPHTQKRGCLYLGLLLRPHLAQPLSAYLTDALPAIPLDLHIDVVEASDEPQAQATPPSTHTCASAGVLRPQVEWQLYTGAPGPAVAPWGDDAEAGWTSLEVTTDGTDGLRRAGYLTLELPRGATAIDPRELPAEFWDDFGAMKPPATDQELRDVLERLDDVTELEKLWEPMGIRDPGLLLEISECGTDAARVRALLDAQDPPVVLSPAKVTVEEWVGADPEFGSVGLPMLDGEYRGLYWVRAKFPNVGDEDASDLRSIRRIRLNTVPATQGQTRFEDRLGLSDGRPGQVFVLPRTPVLIDPASGEPELSITVGGESGWRRADDFYRAGPDDRIYLLDPGTGRITFGDGLRGRIPVAGTAIVADRTRVGGGRSGNVGPGSITKIRGRVSGIKSATNFRAAHDGSDAETLEEVQLRAPHDLRHRDRAVCADDFVDLAMSTPGVALHRVVTLPRTAVRHGVLEGNQDGAVTLVLLMSDGSDPTAAQFDAVCRWLEPRRLVTTELHLTGPRRVEIAEVSLALRVADGHGLDVVADAAKDAVLRFLSPLTGGTDGAGWPPGEAISHADLYQRLLDVPGVRRAWNLKVFVAGDSDDEEPDGGAGIDLTPLAPGELPLLTRDRISMAVSYG